MAADNDLTATFALELNAADAASAANKTADALQSMRDRLRGGIDDLRGMQAAFRNLKGSAGVSADTLAAIKGKIAAQKATVGDLQARYLKLGGGFRQLKPDGTAAASTLDALKDRAKAANGPLGVLAKQLGGVGTITRGGLIAGGIVGIGVALVALAAAAVAAAGALAAYGIKQADARRSELLQLEGLTKIRYGLFGLGQGYQRAADKASFLQDTIDRVSGGVAIGREDVKRYAEQLYKMGLRAGNLSDALEGVAITASTQGDAQAGIFAQWAAGANMTGQSVKALANDVKSRLGGIAKQQLLSLDVQARKLHENFGMIFSGLRIEGLLTGIHELVESFSLSTARGRALKAIVDVIGNTLNGLFDGPALIAKRFFQGMIIGGLHLAIGLLKVRNRLQETFGGSSILKGMNAQKIAVYAGMVAVYGLGAALVLAAGAATLLVGSLAIVVGGVTAVLAGVGAMVVYLVKGAQAIEDWFDAIGKRGHALLMAEGWAGVGKAIVQGIASGISAGWNWVKDAISNLAKSAIGAFKDKFQIHSPSTLFRHEARQIPRGAAMGVEDETPRVEKAMQSMMIPNGKVGTATAAMPTIGSLTVNITGASGQPQDIKQAVIDGVNQLLDQARITMAASRRAQAVA